ncbi:MAG TPA: CoA pyrophosphatase [Nitrospinota bacterium]|nr:CoA pyrophosphatase [Nitrospinota bacterium]
MKEKIKKIFSSRIKKEISRDDLVSAAVLIPLFEKNGEYYILFTKRTESVEHHKGQISFPGGIREQTDRNLKNTVTREVFEEIGLLEKDINIVGELDDIETVTRFKVTPFVGFISYPCKFKINKDEIKELVEVPFSFFLQKENFKEEEWIYEGKKRKVYVYQYNHYRIWGATARIIKSFLDLL